MTIQGAMKELVNLLNADDIPIYYKGGIKKVIETIDDYIDGKDDYVKRKTEQTESECIPIEYIKDQIEEYRKFDHLGMYAEFLDMFIQDYKDNAMANYTDRKTEPREQFIVVKDGKPTVMYRQTEPQTYITEDRDTQTLDAWQVHHRNTTSVENEPQTDCSWK